MSKRPHGETQEERWMRKLKMYEQKIAAKRRRVADQPQNIPPNQQDVQIEEHHEHSEVVFEPNIPTNAESMSQNDAEYAEYSGRDIVFDDISQMTETTAGRSPNSIAGDINENIETDDFDPDLLRELGSVETDPVEFGDDLQTNVAARLQKVLLEGLKKEVKDDLIKKYPFPKNVPLAKSPSLNPEIGAMLAETCKLRDKRLLAKQDQLGKALSALGKALTDLLKKTQDIPNIIRTLNDASILLADSHYTETDTRRSVIMPLIDKSLSEPFKDRKRDAFLFGEKLGELVKDSRGIKKTGELMQPASTTTANLNGRGPSSRGARHQRGAHTYHRRGGGPKPATWTPAYQYPSRRRAAPPPPPPPPPARRQYPPPPPPTRRPPPPAQRPSSNRQT